MVKILLFLFVPVFILLPFTLNNTINRVGYSKEKVYQNKQKPLRIFQKTDGGEKLYSDNCESCHQSDGSGVPGMYPPLQKSDWVNGDKKRLIKIMLNGLQGEIEVNGETYIQSMPSHKYLTDTQIAEVLSFVRKNFNNKASEVKTAEVAALRQDKSK
jgi:mono/diheme cytochrome c family protein